MRKLDKSVPLVILSADSGAFYSKPLLSSAIGAGKSAQALAMSTAEQMAAQLGATVRRHAAVSTIDTAAHTVTVGGETLAYAKLVLALGAEQIRVPIAGDGAAAVVTVNDLDEYARYRELLKDGATVCLIGAGLIGSEFANDLAAGGHAPHAVDLAAWPLGRLLPQPAGELLGRRLAAAGVRWHFNTRVQSIVRAHGRLQVTLADGTDFTVDAALSAIGLRPRVALAQAAGLAVNRGIVVNRLHETSAPDVYALGDCAEVDGMVLPYVMPIMHSARALGATLAGKSTPVAYPAMPIVVKTPACPTVVAPPPADAAGAWEITADDAGVKALYRAPDGRLLGFALVGTAANERAALTPQLPPVLA